MSTMSPRQKPKILCLDDDPAIAAAIAARLTPLGVDVRSAFFGAQGIWLAVTERPDLIISDLRMPNGNGDYVVECLRQRHDTREIPVVVLTGVRDAKSRRLMRSLGVEHYLSKPVDFGSLLAVVGQYVALGSKDNRTESHASTPAGGSTHQVVVRPRARVGENP
jgi:response regulator RpfG family c-di-GMP phosphodiesterase